MNHRLVSAVGHDNLSAKPLEPRRYEQQDASHSTSARQDQEHEMLTRGGGVPKRESDPYNEQY